MRDFSKSLKVRNRISGDIFYSSFDNLSGNGKKLLIRRALISNTKKLPPLEI